MKSESPRHSRGAQHINGERISTTLAPKLVCYDRPALLPPQRIERCITNRVFLSGLQPLKVRWAVYCGVSSVRQRTIANRSLHRIGRPFIHLMCYAVLIHTLGSLCDRSCWSVGVVGLARCARSSASRRLDGARRQPAEQKELDGWRKKLAEQVPFRVTHYPYFLAVIAGHALTNRRISRRSFRRR